MKLSVVVPAYNEEQYIAACLKSLLHQTEPPDEIIVVDNNSTDRTAEIVRQFPGVRLVKETQQGMTWARNAGYDHAKYEIIARCDADTIVSRSWVKRIKDDFKTRNIDAVTGPLHYYDLPVKYPPRLYNAYIKILSKLLKHYPLHGPNMAISRKMWKEVRNEVCTDDNAVHEDHDISLHIYQRGGRILYDRYLTVKTSGRRIKHDPTAFFIEYPVRIAKTIRKHHV